MTQTGNMSEAYNHDTHTRQTKFYHLNYALIDLIFSYYSSENSYCDVFSIGSILHSPSTIRLLYSYLTVNNLNNA